MNHFSLFNILNYLIDSTDDLLSAYSGGLQMILSFLMYTYFIALFKNWK